VWLCASVAERALGTCPTSAVLARLTSSALDLGETVGPAWVADAASKTTDDSKIESKVRTVVLFAIG
jgi:hypothetical protein